MNRVRAWLLWSPFARGTWQNLALNLTVVITVMTIVQAATDQLNVFNFLAGLSGMAVVVAVITLWNVKRSNRYR